MKLTLEFTGPEEELRLIKQSSIEIAKRLNIDGFWDSEDETSRPRKLDEPRFKITYSHKWEDDG